MNQPIRIWLPRIIIITIVGATAYVGWQTLQLEGLPDGFASGNGRIEAVEVDITTRTPGRIKEILVNEGDFVRAGEILARMDTAVLKAQLREAKAQLQQPRNGIETTQSQHHQYHSISTLTPYHHRKVF